MATKKESVEENKAPSLETIQAEVAAILAAAKAEAAQIVADAKAAVGKGNNSRMTAEELEAHEAYMDELVEVKLFKDNGKYKDDVIVGCNGEFIAIKRGERVKIKRKFAEILDNSEHQDYETAKLLEQKAADFAKTGL